MRVVILCAMWYSILVFLSCLLVVCVWDVVDRVVLNRDEPDPRE